MNCPNCQTTQTKELSRKTALGYPIFWCAKCRRTFNQRTGTPFNYLGVPTDMVLMVVVWRLRYKLSLRDLAEMFLERGFQFTHETVREWQQRFASLLSLKLRAKRKGTTGPSWYVDETYVRVQGKWCYLYRAIDRDGNLVDCRLSKHRDLNAAELFFVKALAVIGEPPDRVTTDGHDSYPRAIRKVLGPKVMHRTNRYLNNRLEQDHRGIKQRYYPMGGFGRVGLATRFCEVFEEVRNHFRFRRQMNEKVSLSVRRQIYLERWLELKGMFLAT